MKTSKANSNRITEQNLNIIARRAVLSFLLISIISSLANLILFAQNRGWFEGSSALVWLTMLTAGFLGMILNRAKKARATIWLLVGSTIFLILIYPLLLRGSSIPLSLICTFGLIVIIGRALTPRSVVVILAVSSVLIVISYLLDSFAIAGRPDFTSSFSTLFPFIIITGYVLFIFLRQFGIYSLRTKVIFSFLILSLLIVAIIAGISIRNAQQALTATGEQTLLSAASQVAWRVDNFNHSNMELIQVEAQQPILGRFLALPDEERSPEIVADATQTIISLARKREEKQIGEFNFIRGYLLLDLTEKVVIASDQFLLDKSVQEYFVNEVSLKSVGLSPVLFSQDNPPVIIFWALVRNSDSKPVGILASIYDAAVLQKIIQESGNLAGDHSSALLVDENYLRLGQGITSDLRYQILVDTDNASLQALQQAGRLPDVSLNELRENQGNSSTRLGVILPSVQGVFTFSDNSMAQGKTFLASSATLESQPWLVIYAQEQDFFLAPVKAQIRNVQVVAVLLTALALIVALVFGQVLTLPMTNLIQVAEQISNGDLTARAAILSQDETGKLAATINVMTEQLQLSLSEMEERVRQRTFELERRSRQLQMAADIGRAAATIHNLEELLTRVVIFIGERFNFYHVGMFLVDEAGEYAVLKAANSEGGKRMIARGHKLAIGQQGVVGHVVATGQPRISLDVGEEAELFNNPDLPHTRSEMTLPLISSGELMGALDVHSMKPSAFSTDDLAVMQVLADSIAVAIDNARLFAESKQALEATRRAYGEISHRAWLNRLEGKTSMAFRSQTRGTFQIEAGNGKNELMSTAPQLISLPIKVRDTIIGFVDASKPLEKDFWTTEEEETLQALVDQIGIALESARLYEASQFQAERERLISEIGSKLQESLDVDAVLRSATQEIRQALGLRDVTILLSDEFGIDTGE